MLANIDVEEENRKQKELANRAYQDINWLTTFPLIDSPRVLHYFSTSPFYDADSSNQILLNQGREQRFEFLKDMKGKEFIVNEAKSKPPRLFIIQKQYRHTPMSADILQLYYCLDGNIFVCQDLLEILRSRYQKISSTLLNVYGELMKDDEKDEN